MFFVFAFAVTVVVEWRRGPSIVAGMTHLPPHHHFLSEGFISENAKAEGRPLLNSIILRIFNARGLLFVLAFVFLIELKMRPHNHSPKPRPLYSLGVHGHRMVI